MSRWVVHGRRSIYESEWVQLGLADIEQPDGNRFEHHTVWMPPAAMVALLDEEDEHVLLLWRHRFVTDTWNWELPGGLIDEDERPEETVAREAEEETGYRPARVTHLATYEPVIGMVDCPHYVFLGQDARWVSPPTEKNELDHMQWTKLADLPDLLHSGAVRNSGTMVALLHLLALSGPSARCRPSTP